MIVSMNAFNSNHCGYYPALFNAPCIGFMKILKSGSWNINGTHIGELIIAAAMTAIGPK